jgi:hypothetical protein
MCCDAAPGHLSNNRGRSFARNMGIGRFSPSVVSLASAPFCLLGGTRDRKNYGRIWAAHRFRSVVCHIPPWHKPSLAAAFDPAVPEKRVQWSLALSAVRNHAFVPPVYRVSNSRIRLNWRVLPHAKLREKVLEQLRGLWNILRTKPSVYWAIFSNFQAERQSNHQDLWSGRWESNPRP